MNSKKFNTRNSFWWFKKNIISAMLLLALVWCMPDNDNDLSSDEFWDWIEMQKSKNNRDKAISFDELKASYDSLQKSTAELEKVVNQLLKESRQQDSVSLAEKNRKASEMRFPVFKNPQIQKVTTKDYVVDWDTITIEHFVENLQKQAINWNKFLLEWSPEHILFKDSLFLYNSFDEKNSMWEEVVANMEKNKYQSWESPLTLEEEKKLYDRFLKYIKSRLNGEKQERHSLVRDNVIKKEKRWNVTIYYTDLDKKHPWVLASHPSIKPNNYKYLWRDLNPYNSSDYYSLSYKKPEQKIITIPKDVLSIYGINDPKDISYVLETINNWGEFFLENISTAKVDSTDIDQCVADTKENTQDTLYYTQYYKIPKNGFDLLQIQDYSNFDWDSIRIDSNDYRLTKQYIDIDLNNIVWSKVIIEILNEGSQPPNTLMIKLGKYTKRIEWKKWEIIVLEFE
jgi:hypothetical protein